jgi:hypothetical protein
MWQNETSTQLTNVDSTLPADWGWALTVNGKMLCHTVVFIPIFHHHFNFAVYYSPRRYHYHPNIAEYYSLCRHHHFTMLVPETLALLCRHHEQDDNVPPLKQRIKEEWTQHGNTCHHSQSSKIRRYFLLWTLGLARERQFGTRAPCSSFVFFFRKVQI